MKIPFWKMHGASNDFILVDDRSLTFPASDHTWLERIGARHTGVGCEGILLLQPSDTADFRMRFFNPDGNEVEMCGNGARCVARLAYEIGAAPRRMRIDTVAGRLCAEVREDNAVCLGMTAPHDWRLGQTLQGADGPIQYHFVNTGVPHVVVPVEDLDSCAVMQLGAMIRRHTAFAPAGVNVNFIQPTGPHALRIRTYERGVEAETGACGTGIVAAALLAAKQHAVQPPVQVCAAGGDLTVDFVPSDAGADNVTLVGPAVHVFEGVLTYSE